METNTEQTNVPRPQGKVVSFDKIMTFDQAVDYSLGGYHAANDKSGKVKEGPEQRLWRDAAGAYLAAWTAMQALRALPAEQAVSKARDLLKEANHLADVAAKRD